MAAERPNPEDPDPEKGHIHNELVIVQDAVPVATTSIVTVTESPATPIPSNPPNSVHAPGPSDRAKLQAPSALGGVGRASRGWGRFRESIAKPDSGWGNVSKAESMETLPERGCKSAEPGGLKKTDSCDSGITKSDLRLDEGEARTPGDRSPVQPDGRPPPTVPSPIPPIPEHTLHTALLELRAELKDELSALGDRMVALETQVAEVLRLLRGGKTPPSPVPLFQISRPVSPDSDKEDIFS